jgi:hypothetical protein
MDPLTAGLFVAASFASNLYTSKQQAKIESSALTAQLAQQKLQIAEATYERTRQFRENMSNNLALSGMGVGGVSGFRGVAAQNISDYTQDIAALGNQALFSTVQAQASRGYSKASRLSRDVSSLTDAALLATQLGIFEGKGALKTKKKVS